MSIDKVGTTTRNPI